MHKLTKAFLTREYTAKGKSWQAIANSVGCSKDTVMSRAKQYGIQSRKGGRQRPNLVGETFGFLFVLRSHTGGRRATWVCRCVCGTEVLRTTASLRKPNSHISCWACRNKFISESKWRGCGEISGEFWNRVQRSAECRDLALDVTIEYAWQLFIKQARKCALTNVDLIFDRVCIENTTASLDRIDSSRGYIVGNVQWVHKVINNLKMDLPEEEFVEWCRLVAQHAERNAKA